MKRVISDAAIDRYFVNGAATIAFCLSVSANAAVTCEETQFDVEKVAQAVFQDYPKPDLLVLLEKSPEVNGERRESIKALIEEAYTGGKDKLPAFIEHNFGCKEGA